MPPKPFAYCSVFRPLIASVWIYLVGSFTSWAPVDAMADSIQDEMRKIRAELWFASVASEMWAVGAVRT